MRPLYFAPLLCACVAHEPGPWLVSTPAAEGVEPHVLESLDARAQAGDFGLLDSMLVARHGKIVFERHYEHDYTALSAEYEPRPHQYDYDHPDWHPFYMGTPVHSLQSVTKSVASTLIGVALLRGELESVDDKALAFFPEHTSTDGRWNALTLEDVLTMRSGIEWDEWIVGIDDPRNDCVRLEGSADWVAYTLAKPMATEPGTTFVYNSGSSQLLSAILRRATGVTIDVYAERHLFGPLGIERYHWKKTPTGLPDTEGGLYLEPRDLAKLGQLFLQDGVWEGERLLPEGWVERSTTAHVTDIFPDNGRRDSGYGYKWWIIDDGADGGTRIFAALGYGGQQLLVAPELELLAVFNAWNIHRNVPSMPELFRDELVPAARAR